MTGPPRDGFITSQTMDTVPVDGYLEQPGYAHECNQVTVHVLCTRPSGSHYDDWMANFKRQMRYANTLLGAIWLTRDSFFFPEFMREEQLGPN